MILLVKYGQASALEDLVSVAASEQVCLEWSQDRKFMDGISDL